jgi:hypothetical protein
MRYFMALVFLFAVSGTQVASASQDQDIPLKHWAAPLYWQTPAASADTQAKETDPESRSAATTGILVFVGAMPCRVADTRSATGTFGGPVLLGGSTRSFPIWMSGCGIPESAQAFSLNVTVVPAGYLGWLTMWPHGYTMPVVSTLNAMDGQVTANAAVVPAGIGGRVDVYVSNTTHVIIDINGYYVSASALALAPGSPSVPALTFSTDSNSGLYSPAAGNVAIAAGGTNRVTVNANGLYVNGNVNMTGDLLKSGASLLRASGSSIGLGLATLSSFGGGVNTGVGYGVLNSLTTGFNNTAVGYAALGVLSTGLSNTAIGATSMQQTAEGYYNVAVGDSALRSNVNGSYNTVVGQRATYTSANGISNVGIGYKALESATGSWNTALGTLALDKLTSGGVNLAVGISAGTNLISG